MNKDIAVSVRGISKSYTIAHNAHKSTMLGEQIMHSLKHPFQRTEKETFWALKDVSFDIKKGDVVGIIGRNGAGKSTLLKILSRITEPTTGEIIMDGRVGSLLEVGTGFHPELTGRENIYLNGAILGMKRREIERQFDAIVDFAGVEQFLDTPVKRYSSGMYVRLAFAVAAHLNPEILIVDEVLAVGDTEFQKKCLGKMGEVAKSGRTVLFVSHNMAAVKNLCNQTILLDNGNLKMYSNTADVVLYYETSSYRAGYSEWINTQKERTDDEAYIVSLNIFDGSFKARSSYFNSEEIILRFTLHINEPSTNLKLGVDIVSDGIVAFRSSHIDTWPSTPSLPIGLHKVDCHLPAWLLNGGDYSIIPSLSIHCQKELYNSSHPILGFRIEIDGSCNPFHTILNERNHPGLTFPLLSWTVK